MQKPKARRDSKAVGTFTPDKECRKCNKIHSKVQLCVCDDANMSSKGLLESVPWGLVFVGKRMSSRKSPRSNTGGDRRKTEEKSTLLGTYVEEE